MFGWSIKNERERRGTFIVQSEIFPSTMINISMENGKMLDENNDMAFGVIWTTTVASVFRYFCGRNKRIKYLNRWTLKWHLFFQKKNCDYSKTVATASSTFSPSRYHLLTHSILLIRNWCAWKVNDICLLWYKHKKIPFFTQWYIAVEKKINF